MQSEMSILKGFNMQSEMSILYVLMAVIIFLALMAAIGAWVRGGGLKREDAESLFSESRERQREEILQLQKAVEEARMAAEQAQLSAQQAQAQATEVQTQAAQALTLKLQDIDTQVNRTRTDLETAVSRTAADNHEALSGKLELVSQKLTESEQRMNGNITSLNDAMHNVHQQVSHAGEQMKEALIEIARQQQDQKAQGTIQMCEALITSLGTLKTSIASQLTLNAYDDTPKQMVEGDSVSSNYEPDEPFAQDQHEEESDQASEPDLTETSGASEFILIPDNEKEEIEQGGIVDNPDAQIDSSNWGDAAQVPADDQENTDNNHDNHDNQNDDSYPPPIY